MFGVSAISRNRASASPTVSARQRDELRGHQSAGCVVFVRKQLGDVSLLVVLHQAEQLFRLLREDRQARRLLRQATSIRECRRRVPGPCRRVFACRSAGISSSVSAAVSSSSDFDYFDP